VKASKPRLYYEDYWQQRERFVTQPSRQLLGLFERHVAPDDRCLDVGCGDGGTSGVWLHENAGSYVGVDISDAAIRTATSRGLTAQLIDDAASLPFEAGSFDLVVCVEVLEHLFEPERAVQEIGRVLRPGGRLIATVPNVAHWRIRLDLAVLGRWNPRGDALSGDRPWRDPHVRFFSKRSFARMIESCGFELMECGGGVERAMAEFVPGLRRLSSPRAGAAARRATGRMPGLLAETLHVVARRADARA
jgi:methionine biosynthesis protein MetW